MTSTDHRTPPTRQERHTVELTRTEALALLGQVSLGRVVFTQRALPAVRPVNHLLDGDDIVVRTHDSSALLGQARPHGAVVAYQADALDPVTHLGWSVVVTGYCRPVTDPADLARYARLLQPWPRLPGQVMDSAVRITPHLVSGVRLVAAG
ncbi:MAG: pyridoxamine 5'-phosphate oxidase family protein [Streptomyces albidoflavus]